MKAAPKPRVPPLIVVPYKFPSAPTTNAPLGLNPSVQLGWLQKLYTGVKIPSEVILNTVPRPLLPPKVAVPYKLPSVPCVRVEKGLAPSVPLNTASVVKVCAFAEAGVIERHVLKKLDIAC